MHKFIYTGVIALLIMGVTGFAPGAHAETTTTTATNTAMLEQIQALMAKLQELQKQLAAIRGEINTVLKENISEGLNNADVKKIQEILATDSAIYPEGKVTGYFGPLTKEAIKRFQVRHELEVTGTIDEATHDLLEEYLKETTGGVVPPGLLKAPGIGKKIEMRFKEGCDNSGKGKADFCRKLKIKYKDNELEIEDETEMEDEDEDDDEDEDEDEDDDEEDEEDEDSDDDN
jgi:hypothetical protein